MMTTSPRIFSSKTRAAQEGPHIQLLANVLQAFPSGVGALTWGERLSVLDAWVQVLDGVYAHLPRKRALYEFDPLRAIEHLRQQVPALNDLQKPWLRFEPCCRRRIAPKSQFPSAQ